MGVERKLFFSILMAAFLVFHFFNALLSAALLFVVLWFFARAASEADPELLKVLLQSNRFAVRYDPALRQEANKTDA